MAIKEKPFEVWNHIPGFEWGYEYSSYLRIRESFGFKNESMLSKTKFDIDGVKGFLVELQSKSGAISTLEVTTDSLTCGEISEAKHMFNSFENPEMMLSYFALEHQLNYNRVMHAASGGYKYSTKSFEKEAFLELEVQYLAKEKKAEIINLRKNCHQKSAISFSLNLSIPVVNRILKDRIFVYSDILLADINPAAKAQRLDR